MKKRIQYNYYFNGKKYSRKTLAQMTGSDAFYKHIKDFEHKPSRYSNIVKTSYGYDYTFTSGLFKGDTINIHIKKITKQRINLDKFFYTLDIETSTFNNNQDVDWKYTIRNGCRNIERCSDEVPVSIPYLCGIRQYDIRKFYNSPISSGYIADIMDEQNFKGYQGLRTYDDILAWLITICNIAKECNTVKFIIIQNNAYEHSFLHSNVYTKLPEGFKYDASYIRPHKPMKIDIYKDDDLCVRILDSYLLTGKSISSYGATYGYPKLEKTDDYNSTFTPESVLPQDEYIYNKRDLDISALMFINVIKDLTTSCDKKMDEVLPKLFTKTGVTRLKNKWLFENQKDNLYYNRYDMLKDTLNSEIECFSSLDGSVEKKKRFSFNHDCFIGGYVRANENTVYKIQRKVKSIDITSSYPYSMKSKVYGYRYKPVDDNFNKMQFLQEWKFKAKKLMKNFNKFLFYYFNNFLMFELSMKNPFWNASIIISDIQPKPLWNENSMLVMSSSKVIEGDNLLVNNGRVVTGKRAVINVSCVELLNYLLLYDFNIDAVSYMEVAEINDRLPKSVIKTIDYYYKRKSDFKILVRAKEKGKLIPALKSLKDISLNEYEQNYIKEHQNDADISTWLNTQLVIAKADLNAQYGINVEKPNHDDIICTDNNIYQIISNEVEQSIFRRNYKVGMLITAWSRMHLILMSLVLIQAGAVIHYWDTDSIKFTGSDDIDAEVHLFNRKVGKFENCEGIGTFTFEYLPEKNYSYDYFISGGSKNYWYMNDNHINATVSGLSARSIPMCNDYYQKNCKSFKDFVISVLQPMTYFDGLSINTMLTDYTHQSEEVDVTVNGYHFKGYSGVIINQPQSRGLLPYPSRFIESRFWYEYGIRCIPQLFIKDAGEPVILQIKENDSKEVYSIT